MGNRVRVRLDLFQPALGRHQADDALARLEAVDAVHGGDQARQFVIARLEAVEKLQIAFQRDTSFSVQYIDRTHAFGFMTTADLEIVEVVGRRDLDRARPFFGIGIGVGDDRHQPPDQRQADSSAGQALIARIVGMHGDRAVAEHRLRPRRRHGHLFAALLAGGVDHGVVEIIERAVGILGQRLGQRGLVERRAAGARPLERAPAFDMDDFEVGNRGLEFRVPVDQALGFVDQPFAAQLHEHLGDRLRQAFVEREALAAPVARGAEALELGDDGAARLGLPLPDPREKRFPSQGPTVGLLALHQLALDHHLRGDPRVVGAGLPEHVLAVHAVVATEDVLQGVVERVAHVQGAGDVGRRNDDAKGLGARPLGAAGAKGALRFPALGDALFDDGGFERLFHHLATPGTARAERGAAAPRRVEDSGAPERPPAKAEVPCESPATAAPA